MAEAIKSDKLKICARRNGINVAAEGQKTDSGV